MVRSSEPPRPSDSASVRAAPPRPRHNTAMEHRLFSDVRTGGSRAATARSFPARDPVGQAYWILRIGFAVSTFIAGVDKFTNVLVDWSMYLAPWLSNLVGGPYPYFYAVGVVEMLVAIGVAVMPRVFSYVLCVWLLASAFNLLTYPGFYDIALRDIVMALGALALARLSMVRPVCRSL